ncbi:MAG: hypothetical protein M1334_02310 [Patescibacteria group bacterium]|nr:hypothetical protein [Patescibacteria group bacterium]
MPTGWNYNYVSSTSSRNTDGTGWIPVRLASTSSGTPLGSLPIDPVNTTSSGYYYTYATDNNGGYELTMVPESQKYTSNAASDGGLDPSSYETGNKLTITHFAHGMVGYWPLNEGQGTVVYDHSLYGDNGTLATASSTCGSACYPQWTTSGCLNGGSCLGFNTIANSYNYTQQSSRALPMGSNPRTMTAWIKTTPGLNSVQIMAYGNGGSASQYSGIYITNSRIY